MRRHGLTAAEFEELATRLEYRPEFAHFLSQHMRLTVSGSGPKTIALDSKGRALTVPELYTAVRADDSLDRAVYQLAMSVWR